MKPPHSVSHLNPRSTVRVHPGISLAWRLEAIGMSAKDLAEALGLPARRVKKLLKGKRDISAAIALRLARYFGTTPQEWLVAQQEYDLAFIAEELAPDLARIIPRGDGGPVDGTGLPTLPRGHHRELAKSASGASPKPRSAAGPRRGPAPARRR
jgi:antitoxin HigA-1